MLTLLLLALLLITAIRETKMKTIIAAALIAASVTAHADSFSIGYSNGGGSVYYSQSSRHHYHTPPTVYMRGYSMPAYAYNYPVPVYVQPQIVYQAPPQVIYQQAYPSQYRGGTYYVPDGAYITCTYPREYDRVCNSNGSFCVPCN